MSLQIRAILARISLPVTATTLRTIHVARNQASS